VKREKKVKKTKEKSEKKGARTHNKAPAAAAAHHRPGHEAHEKEKRKGKTKSVDQPSSLTSEQLRREVGKERGVAAARRA